MCDHPDPQDLPEIIQQYLQRLACRTRNRHVRRDVLAELSAHFADALDGTPSAQDRNKLAASLIADFGDTKILSKLIKRAKKRCRPLWVKFVIRTCQTLLVLMLIFAGYTAWFISGTATISVDYLAKLAAVVRGHDPEIRFLVVGSGGEHDKVRNTAKTLGVLEENFFMLPPISKAEMPAVLSAADIATSVFVDVEEMWSNSANKVFDALAAARPVAINHQGWIAELIRQTGCGLELDVKNLDDSAEKLIAAVRSPLWLARAGAAAARVAEERFDRDRLAATLASVLEGAIGEVPRRAAA